MIVAPHHGNEHVGVLQVPEDDKDTAVAELRAQCRRVCLAYVNGKSYQELTQYLSRTMPGEMTKEARGKDAVCSPFACAAAAAMLVATVAPVWPAGEAAALEDAVKIDDKAHAEDHMAQGKALYAQNDVKGATAHWTAARRALVQALGVNNVDSVLGEMTAAATPTLGVRACSSAFMRSEEISFSNQQQGAAGADPRDLAPHVRRVINLKANHVITLVASGALYGRLPAAGALAAGAKAQAMDGAWAGGPGEGDLVAAAAAALLPDGGGARAELAAAFAEWRQAHLPLAKEHGKDEWRVETSGADVGILAALSMPPVNPVAAYYVPGLKREALKEREEALKKERAEGGAFSCDEALEHLGCTMRLRKLSASWRKDPERDCSVRYCCFLAVLVVLVFGHVFSANNRLGLRVQP